MFTAAIKVQKCFDSSMRKVFIKLGDHENSKHLEEFAIGCLTKNGGIRKFGQAPKGSLECEAQKFLDQISGKSSE